jgi:hypothetical protein
MELYQFKPITRAKDRRRGEREDEESPLQTSIQNLYNQLPAEATGLYLAGISLVEATPLTLTLVAVFALGLMILIRVLAKAKAAVLITSTIGFIIWAFAIPGGPFQAFNLELPLGLGAFLIVAYSALVTVLANAGVLGKPKEPEA